MAVGLPVVHRDDWEQHQRDQFAALDQGTQERFAGLQAQQDATDRANELDFAQRAEAHFRAAAAPYEEAQRQRSFSQQAEDAFAAVASRPPPAQAAPPGASFTAQSRGEQGALGRVYRDARAAGLDDDGARAAVAVARTEGGYGGAQGDAAIGGSRGTFQFYFGGGMGNAYAKSRGIPEAQADAELAADPHAGNAWALGGYLGGAIRGGQAKGLSGPALAEYAQRHGQRSVSPERAAANYGLGLEGAPAPATGLEAPVLPREEAQAGAPRRAEAVGQFEQGLPYEEAAAICGPVAALAFAQANGRNPDLGEARRMARRVGWTAAGGMNGVANEQRLLTEMGVASRLDTDPDFGEIAQDAASGNPVIVSTARHYYFVNGYDPATGKLRVGKTGEARRGGAAWMSAQQIAELDGGINGVLYVDNPRTPTPSVAARPPAAVEGDRPASEFEPPSAFAPAPERIVPELDRPITPGDVGQPTMRPEYERISRGRPGPTDVLAATDVPNRVGFALAHAALTGQDPARAILETAREGGQAPTGEDLLAAGGVPAGEARRVAGRYLDFAADYRNFVPGLAGGGKVSLGRQAIAEPLGGVLGGEAGGALGAAVGGETGRRVGETVGQIAGAGVAGSRYQAIEENPATRRLGIVAGGGEGGVREPTIPAATAPERAGNIRPEKFPEEIRPLIAETVEERGGYLPQRRGVVSDQQARAEAARVALGTTVEDWVASKPGRAFTQAEGLALGETMARVGDEYRSFRDAVRAAREAGTATPEMEARLAAKTLEWSTLVGVRAGGAAEAGRALRAFRAALTGEAGSRRAAIQRAFNQIGGQEKFAEWLTNFEAIPDTDRLAQYRMLQALHTPSAWDRIQILRYASMLSSSATHLTNATANLIGVGSDIALKPFYAGLDAAVAGVTGGERTRYLGETIPQLKGAVEGFWTGAKQAGQILRTGVTVDDLGKLEVRRPGLQSGSAVVDAVAEMPLRALSAADAVFRGAALGGHLNALATRQALREGLRGPAVAARAREVLASLPEHPALMEEANQAAARTVVQESRALSSFVARGRQVPGLKYALDVFLPFVRTPYNIAAQGAGLTPAGLLGVIQAAKAGNKGEAIDRATRAMVGTGAMGLAAYLGANGFMTGGTPTDPVERSTLPEGWQPWSLRIPRGDGAVYVEIKNLGPWAIPLAIGAVAGDAYRRGGELPEKTLVDAVKTIGRYMQDQTFLQGMNNIVKTIEDPARYAENVTEGIASSFVPYGALQRQIDRALGGAQRDPHGAIEAILATSPLLEQAALATGARTEPVQPRRTALGDPQVATQTGLGAFVAPARYGVERDEPTLAVTREARAGLPAPGPTVLGIPITEPEQRRVQARAGALMRERIGPLQQDPEFRALPLRDRGQIVERLRDQAHEDAGVEVLDTLSDEEVARRRGLVERAKDTRQPLAPLR